MRADDILTDLVQFPSVVGTSNAAVMGYVEAYLSQHGARTHVLPGPDVGRSNLFASLGPDNQPGYILSAHVDVVPADEPDWLGDPFELRKTGDCLIGRGAVDMKGYVAAVLSCVPALAGLTLKAPIHIALSYDEEAGCRGVPHLISALPDLCETPLGCFVGEPTGMTPVLGHKGKATLRLRASGKASHSSRPDLGDNAIHGLLPILNGLLDLSSTLEAANQHPAFTPPHSTLQIGTILGGSAVNVVPDAAEALVELRAIPGHDPKAMLAPMIEKARAAGIEADIVAAYPGLDLPDADPLASLAAQLSGRNAQTAVSFGTEAGLFQQAGIPAIVCGPGDIARAHRPEEFITTGELDGARAFVMALGARLS